MAALHEVPFGLYYGSVDSTPLFVMLAGLYAERTGDCDTLKELWPAYRDGARLDRWPGRSGWRRLRRISARHRTRARRTRAGRIRYDAIFHADGALAEGPIALAEVQGYVYAAKRLASRCARRLGRARRRPRAGSGSGRARATFRGGVLVRGYRHLRACARRRQAALPRAHARMPGKSCLPASGSRGPRPQGRRPICCGRTSSPAGVSAPSPPAKRATIRCRIMTVRSGRMTTR